MTTIYHNPRCSKSRQALALLEQRGIRPKIVEYLKMPPTAEELLSLCEKMKIRPVRLIRAKEARFRELGLSLDDERSDAEWCRIMSENPVLIERPIVVHGRKAVLGRPPEKVLEIL